MFSISYFAKHGLGARRCSPAPRCAGHRTATDAVAGAAGILYRHGRDSARAARAARRGAPIRGGRGRATPTSIFCAARRRSHRRVLAALVDRGGGGALDQPGSRNRWRRTARPPGRRSRCTKSSKPPSNIGSCSATSPRGIDAEFADLETESRRGGQCVRRTPARGSAGGCRFRHPRRLCGCRGSRLCARTIRPPR